MVPVAQETTVNTVRLPYSFSRRFSLVAWCKASLEILHVHPLSLSVLQELQRGLNAPFTRRQIDGAEFEQRLNAVWQRDSSEARQLMEISVLLRTFLLSRKNCRKRKICWKATTTRQSSN